MHELGLANGIFDLVQQYVPEARAPRLTRVHVRIGEFAGVLPESLSFCFSAIVQGTPYEKATLDITRSQGREMVVSELELEDDPEKGTVPFSTGNEPEKGTVPFSRSRP
jgi:hypothetical protein